MGDPSQGGGCVPQRAYGKVWVERGLFGKVHRHGAEFRIGEANVVRFVREHAREYDLARVDQTWYKAMAFAELAEYGERV